MNPIFFVCMRKYAFSLQAENFLREKINYETKSESVLLHFCQLVCNHDNITCSQQNKARQMDLGASPIIRCLHLIHRRETLCIVAGAATVCTAVSFVNYFVIHTRLKCVA